MGKPHKKVVEEQEQFKMCKSSQLGGGNCAHNWMWVINNVWRESMAR